MKKRGGKKRLTPQYDVLHVGGCGHLKPSKAGVWMLIERRRQRAFFIARGVEQPEKIEKGRESFVEVGPVRTVGFRVQPSSVITTGANLLMLPLPHAVGCEHCSNLLYDVVTDLSEALRIEDEEEEDGGDDEGA